MINIYNNANDLVDVKVSESLYVPNNYDVFIDRKEDYKETVKNTSKITPEKEKLLKDVAVGSKMYIGDYEFIVLDHRSNNTTFVVCSNIITKMHFGTTNYWYDSDIRKFLNEDFYYSLCNNIDYNDIILHTVELTADDGTGEMYIDTCKISLLSASFYRRYREFILPISDTWWWTLTPVSYEDEYSQYVCFVNSDGTFRWSGCERIGGVRPFCVLNSDISVKI